MIQLHHTQVERQPPQYLAITGAVLDAVPSFNGTEYVPRLPVAAFNAGTPLGRVSEINVTGAGGFASVTGNRITINVDKGVNARSTFPSIGVYQPVNNIDLGAGINTTISAGTLTISTSAATPQVGLYNVGPGAGIVQSPGASSSHNLKTLVGLGGITIQDFGSYLGIQSATGGSTFSQFRVQTADTFGNVTGNEFITDNGIVRFTAGAGIGISQTSLGSGSTLLTISATGGTGGGGLTGNNGNGLTVTPTTVSLALANTSSAGALPALSGNGTHFLRGDGFWGFLDMSVVTSFNGSRGAINLTNGANTTVVALGGGNFRIDATGGGGTSGHTIGNGALGAGIVSVPGFATSHTLKGLLGGGNTTVTDMGSHILISSSGGTGGSGSIEVRYNNTVINPNTSIINFSGAGVNVSNFGYVEVNIPGGGGTSGVSVNGVGPYSNLIFTGAGVSTSANVITILGGGGAANSPVLSVNSGAPSVLSVSPTAGNVVITPLGISTSFTPSLSGNTLALPNVSVTNGITTSLGTTFITLPSSGSSGVSSISSLNPSLTVSPSTGNVTLNTTGFSGAFSPTWTEATRTLAVPNLTASGGIVTNVATTFLTISGGSSYTHPTFTSFSFTPIISVDTPAYSHTITIPTVQTNTEGHVTNLASTAIVIPPHRLFLNILGSFNAQGTSQGSATTHWKNGIVIKPDSSMYANFNGSTSDFAVLEIGLRETITVKRFSGTEHGFFGANPVPRPNVVTGDLSSFQNALQSLGLINLI